MVEDCENLAATYGELLSLWGYDVRIVHTGTSALEVYSAYQPHILLLDIQLPDVDGFEVARRVRVLPGGKDVALVAMTGYSAEFVAQHAPGDWYDALLHKPMRPDTLREVVARAALKVP